MKNNETTYLDKNRKLFIGSNAVLIYLDETGDPKLKYPGNPVFGFGGIAITPNQRENISNCWGDVRQALVGSKGNIVHATEIREINDAKNLIISDFFKNNFFRFSVIGKINTSYHDESSVVWGPLYTILDKVIEIIVLSDQYKFSEIVIIVEDSTMRKVVKKLIESYSHPIFKMGVQKVCAFISKDVKEPCLDVADFISYSASIHLRKYLKIPISNKLKEKWPSFVFDVPENQKLFLQLAEIVPEA